MVRDRTLNEEDLVRADYSKDWQTTESVVGLFHMANRVPVPLEDSPVKAAGDIATSHAEPPPGIATGIATSELTPASSATSTDESHIPGRRTFTLDQAIRWTRGATTAGGGASAPALATASDEFGDILAAAPSMDEDERESDGFISITDPAGAGPEPSSRQWDSIVQAAVESVDARHGAHAEFSNEAKGFTGRIVACYRALSDAVVLREFYRVGFASLCVWGFSVWVNDWSTQQVLQSPPARPEQQSIVFFPAVGACQTDEFWLLVFLNAAVIATCTYIVAAKIEKRFLEIS